MFEVRNRQVTETWKPVAGHAGYEVSDLGRVRSFRSKNGLGPLKSEPHDIKPWINRGNDRPMVTFTGRKKFVLSRVVLESFVGPCPAGMECCHQDGNHHNNHLSNLRWDTKVANAMDRTMHGRTHFGEKHPNSKLSKQQAQAIAASTEQSFILASRFGVSRDLVKAIRNGKVRSKETGISRHGGSK